MKHRWLAVIGALWVCAGVACTKPSEQLKRCLAGDPDCDEIKDSICPDHPEDPICVDWVAAGMQEDPDAAVPQEGDAFSPDGAPSPSDGAAAEGPDGDSPPADAQQDSGLDGTVVADGDSGPAAPDCGGCTSAQYCEPGSLVCVQCTENAHCLSGLCRSDFTCADCDGPEDCSGGVCVQEQCYECATNADCTMSSAPLCDPTTLSCVACLGDSDCSGTTPLCDPAALACVACLTNANCDADAPVCVDGACSACTGDADCKAHPETPACVQGSCEQCSESNDSLCGDEVAFCGDESRCVECLSDLHCTSDAPVCDPAGVCAGCLEDAECGRFASTPVCEELSGACVQCETNADCRSENAPICRANHACGACQADSDCAPQGEVCDESSGRCVACEPNAHDPEAENCANGRACHPESLTCTGRPRGSLSSCGGSTEVGVGVVRCISDSECSGRDRCVAMEFPRGTDFGRYCLPEANSGACPNLVPNPRPATSTLGVSGTFCFPSYYTTCEGLLDFKNPCETDEQCGAEGVDDGRCVDKRCSYECEGDTDCARSSVCTGSFELGRYCLPR